MYLLIRFFIPTMIVLSVILLLYKIGFVWNYEDLESNTGLTKYIKEDERGKVEYFMNDFSERREDLGVLDLPRNPEDEILNRLSK